MRNPMTEAMDRATKMATAADTKLKVWGEEAYGMKQATEAQLRERFQNIKADEIVHLVAKFGQEEVNKMLRKYGKEEYIA